MLADPQKVFSTEEYLHLENSTEWKSEFFNGQIYAMAGASPNHVRLSGNAYHTLRTQLVGSSCEAFNSDRRVQISETSAYVYPDVTVACPPVQFSEHDPNALTNPTVLIEVLSPSTEAHGRGDKWAHYQRFTSLCDYVLVAQDQMRLEHYQRQEDGSWRYSVAEGEDAFLPLDSIGCQFRVSEVYERVELAS
jgi:Uma2 family endonuclease